MSEEPLSRWARGGEKNLGYGRRFAELVDSGADVDGEGRLADVLVPRQARILDAGSGMGRVAAYLHDRGTGSSPPSRIRAWWSSPAVPIRTSTYSLTTSWD